MIVINNLFKVFSVSEYLIIVRRPFKELPKFSV